MSKSKHTEAQIIMALKQMQPLKGMGQLKMQTLTRRCDRVRWGVCLLPA
jgi:hypothetical protein